MATNTSVETGVSTWKIDPAHTLVEFSAKHMKITTVKGRFTGVEETLVTDADDPDGSRVEVRIDADSIDTGSADRDKHLRSGDFLDVENHPEITFESRSVKGAHAEEGDSFKVIGDLTIRGTTREVELDAEYHGHGGDPWGGERASFSARTKIDRRDWGLTWNQALETGGLLVSNEIKISLEVQAVLQES